MDAALLYPGQASRAARPRVLRRAMGPGDCRLDRPAADSVPVWRDPQASLASSASISGVSTLLFAATVVLTYMIGRTLWHARLGWHGALLLATPYAHAGTVRWWMCRRCFLRGRPRGMTKAPKGPGLVLVFHDDVDEHRAPGEEDEGLVEVGQRRPADPHLVRLVPPHEQCDGLDAEAGVGNDRCGQTDAVLSKSQVADIEHHGDEICERCNAEEYGAVHREYSSVLVTLRFFRDPVELALEPQPVPVGRACHGN